MAIRQPIHETTAVVPRLFPTAVPGPVQGPGGGWAWYGLHGGAGVTTLATAVPGGVDFGGLPYQYGHPTLPVVAVCRSHASGLSAAQRWAAWAAQNPAAVNLLGLVVVADAPGRLPRSLESTIRLIKGGYPRLWRVPFVQFWRVGVPPSAQHLPAAGRQLHKDLTAQAGLNQTGGS